MNLYNDRESVMTLYETVADGKTLFHGQFLLSDRNVPELTNWKQVTAGEHLLYAHPELETTIKEKGNFKFILLGYFYDYRNPTFLNADIVDSLKIDDSISSMMQQLQFMSGIYLIIWKRENDVVLIPDLCSLREAYIHQKEGCKVVAGSTPDILRCIRPVVDRADTGFYSSKLFKKRYVWVGGATSYQDIFRIRANHYLTLSTGELIRFFPEERLQRANIQDTVKEVSAILPGIFKAICYRKKKVMIGLTAGWDSRLLLAASRDVNHKLIYYVNIYPDAPEFDHRIPIRLATRFNLTFTTVHYGNKLASGEPEITATSTAANLSTNKIMRFKNLFAPDKSVSGAISEITRNEFGIIRKLSGSKLSQLAKFENDPFCVAVYNEWLDRNQVRFSGLGYNALDMFYWEEVVANRLGKSITEVHALKHYIFPVFNCRYLINALLRVDHRYRDKQNNVLYTEIIRVLWPELLDESINPGFKKQTIRVMQKLRIYNIYRSVFTRGIGFHR